MKDYFWKIEDLDNTPKTDINVMSVFSGGGGSTMGHKLAGHNVIANVEIDKKQNHLYNLNFRPKYSYEEDIRDVLTKAQNKELPQELYNLDFFDGSPPCSSFSTLGTRERDWGKEKKFKEGQKEQTLDDLFFVTLDLIDELKPKVFCLENVKGIVQGNALTEYTHKILEDARKIGYHCFWVLANSTDFGVPQSRNRVFFIGLRADIHQESQLGEIIREIKSKNSNTKYKTPPKEKMFLTYGAVQEKAKEIDKTQPGVYDNYHLDIKPGGVKMKLYNEVKPTETNFMYANYRFFGKYSNFADHIVDYNAICPTLSPTIGLHLRDTPKIVSNLEKILMASFPYDYNFDGKKAQYVVGMSVPPLLSNGIVEIIMSKKDSTPDNLEEW